MATETGCWTMAVKIEVVSVPTEEWEEAEITPCAALYVHDPDFVVVPEVYG
jgi:hypothetical protein